MSGGYPRIEPLKGGGVRIDTARGGWLHLRASEGTQPPSVTIGRPDDKEPIVLDALRLTVLLEQADLLLKAMR